MDPLSFLRPLATIFGLPVVLAVALIAAALLAAWLAIVLIYVVGHEAQRRILAEAGTLASLAFAGVVAAAFLIGLSGCSATVAASPPNGATAAPATGVASTVTASVASSQAKIDALTIADLQAAQADANAAGDPVASNCYGFLIALKQGQASRPGVVGVVSAFQRLRDLDKAIVGASPAFAQACGPLVVDVQQAIVRGGALAASSAALLPVFAGLPAAIGGAVTASGTLAGIAAATP